MNKQRFILKVNSDRKVKAFGKTFQSSTKLSYWFHLLLSKKWIAEGIYHALLFSSLYSRVSFPKVLMSYLLSDQLDSDVSCDNEDLSSYHVLKTYP